MTTALGRDADLVAAAHDVVTGLERSAVEDESGVTWHAEVLVDVRDDVPVLETGDVGPVLYDGTAGIALVLAAAGRADVALAAARNALAGGARLLGQGRLGLFDGAAGIAVAAVRTARLVDDAALLRQAAALAQQVAEAASDVGGEPDLIGGFAGTTLALLDLADLLDDPGIAVRADTLGRRLAATAQEQTWGAAWPSPDAPPLLGLGHGAAGMTLALAEVAARTGDPHVVRALEAGLRYERGWYDPDRVGWPDLRGTGPTGLTSPGAGSMTAWCHGALGIGLARLRLHALTGDGLALVEASASLQAARNLVVGAGTSLRAGSPADCTPCHGLAAVAELLLTAAHALDVPEHARAAGRVAALLLEQRRAADSWPCGLTGAGEVPGLMTGTAGIALTLLRVAGAVQLPTPLLPGPCRW